ncbi:hypothetical protein [Novosphingobium colocasiae]|uniref:hypothetical protein n=1 Tax=Novosphingobium colocasiae TaxID=1256513 RepID=UPI0035ADF282
MRTLTLLLAPAALLTGCTPEPDAPEASQTSVAEDMASPVDPSQSATELPADHLAPDDPPVVHRPLAADLVRREWARAANRKVCAPLLFNSDAGAPASPRAAHFAGGWAVAFDLPGTRSAYGIAGTGSLDEDEVPPAQSEARLREQWPHFTRLPDLPQPAYAGYGLEGARPFAATNPDGRGENALAYVRVGGQRCLYNVWSRLGRAHLEALLDSLRQP